MTEHSTAAPPAGRDSSRVEASGAFCERMTLTLTPEMNRALDLARCTDGVSKTARLRSLVALWMTDESLRVRADEHALDWT